MCNLRSFVTIESIFLEIVFALFQATHDRNRAVGISPTSLSDYYAIILTLQCRSTRAMGE